MDTHGWSSYFYSAPGREVRVEPLGAIENRRKLGGETFHIDRIKAVEKGRWWSNKLNPAKCAFGVPAEKLLGFIVSHRGIELDPSKIKSIQDLPPPKSKKDVLSFLGCLNYIRRFLKLATVICEPIFKIMRKDIVMSWTKECQKAFDIIKEYLSKPLVLVPSEPGRRLLLYLSMLDGNFDCVLGQHDENGRKDQAINYLSKKFTPYEARYSLLGHGAQEQTLADHLTENPVDGEYEPLKTYFPHEKVLFIGEDIAEAYDGRRMFFDRTANFKGIGIEAVLKCHQCQVHSDMIRVPPNELNVMISPWPFSAWGMDVIGPIEPTVSKGNRFILLAIDYFAKCVETASYKAMTKKVVIDFVRDYKLSSDLMKATCETFKIKHRNSTAYRTQINGAVKAANKNIKKKLRNMVDNYKQWHEKLPFSLLGYRTTVRITTGETLYLLVYGTEAVIHTEVEIPSLRIIQEAELSDAEWI
nr:uncharacterized protein LOC117278990 [Nicotiana tomentosiformis]